MSKLFELAKRVARRVLQPRSTLKVPPPPAPIPPGGMKSLQGAPPIVQRTLPPGGLKSRPGAPPIISRPNESAPKRNEPTPQEERDIKEVQETFDDIQLLGRDRGHSDEMQAVMDGMRRVSSSNVSRSKSANSGRRRG